MTHTRSAPRAPHLNLQAILEKALDPEHPNVATALENYALLLRSLGRLAEAEEYLRIVPQCGAEKEPSDLLLQETIGPSGKRICRL